MALNVLIRDLRVRYLTSDPNIRGSNSKLDSNSCTVQRNRIVIIDHFIFLLLKTIERFLFSMR